MAALLSLRLKKAGMSGDCKCSAALIGAHDWFASLFSPRFDHIWAEDDYDAIFFSPVVASGSGSGV